MKKAIVQCFDVPLSVVRASVADLAGLGFSHVQIGPVQRHCVHMQRRWRRLYQPTGDVRPGNSLGSADDLRALVATAAEHNVGVVVDLVLHHTTECLACNISFAETLRWAAGAATDLVLRRTRRPCERFDMKDWGPRQKVELDSILSDHVQLVRNLLEMGVAGFRFDACKHIPAAHFEALFAATGMRDRPDLLLYGEALDGDPAVLNEYTHLMSMFDFPLAFTMVTALAPGGDIRSVARETINPWRSVPLADCHDSVIGSSYSFGDDTDGTLAVCFLLARGAGIPMVYSSKIHDKRVHAALRFFHATSGTGFFIRPADSTQTRLVMTRGDRGLFVLNKSGKWDGAQALEMHGMREGLWRELLHGFDVVVSNGWVKEWGVGSGKGGFSVGPRSALFLVPHPSS